jgi:hypothetical protein
VKIHLARADEILISQTVLTFINIEAQRAATHDIRAVSAQGVSLSMLCAAKLMHNSLKWIWCLKKDLEGVCAEGEIALWTNYYHGCVNTLSRYLSTQRAAEGNGAGDNYLCAGMPHTRTAHWNAKSVLMLIISNSAAWYIPTQSVRRLIVF